jgi:hypothetical protein
MTREREKELGSLGIEKGGLFIKGVREIENGGHHMC